MHRKSTILRKSKRFGSKRKLNSNFSASEGDLERLYERAGEIAARFDARVFQGVNKEEPSVEILEVAHLLQKKFALLPGLIDKDGNPCLILNDDLKCEMFIEKEFFTVLDYLMRIGREIWVDCKYSMIIDRRTDKWMNVKTILEKLSKIPATDIVQLLVLKPKGFFQKHFYSSSYNALNDAVKHHKLTILDSLSDLHDYIPATNLPEYFGGQLKFDHMEWIEHKTAIERFELTCRKTEKRMKQLRSLFGKVIPLTNVSQIEELAESHQKLVGDIEDDIRCSQDISETLTTLVEKPFNRKGHSPLSQYNITCLKKWTTYLQEMRVELDLLWAAHDKKLQESLSLCNFEEEFCVVSKEIMELTSTLEARTDIGESLDACRALMSELNGFRDKSMGPYEKMKTVREKGYAMIFTGHYLVHAVKLRCDEIKKLCSEFDSKLESRQVLLQTSIDVYLCLDQIHAWCKTGVDLLASQSAASFQTLDGATKGLKEINEFLSNGKGISMGKMNKLNVMCKDLKNPVLDQKVKEALERITQVTDMISKRENSLKKVASKDKRPIQPVQPINVKNEKVKEKVKEKEKTKEKENTTPDPIPPPRTPKDKKRKESRGMAGTVSTEPEKMTKQKSNEERKKSIEIILAKDDEPTKSRRSFRKSFKMRRNMRMTIELGEDDPQMVRKRGLIMNELIDTERVYVKDLLCVIEGYYNAYDEEKYEIPPHLHGMKDVIFGNIKEIYNFHNDVFLKELESCEETPQQIGSLFLSKREEFQLYATYCKNKPTSETLRKDLSSSSFLTDRQAELGHQLPLDAYLLKPVQRITKYQLLIGEMKKNTNKRLISFNQLQSAADTMKKVLRHVNDVMHSTGLTGYFGNIDNEGQLVLQDTFVVWEVQKKVLKQFSNLRGKQRQLFLFQKSLIFSKAESESSTYQFKGSLKTHNIGLTEIVKGHPTKFEIRIHGQSNVYVVQASSQEVKDIWVLEIRKLLLKQFDSVKESAISSPKLLEPSSGNDNSWRSSAPDLANIKHSNSQEAVNSEQKSPRKSPMGSPFSKRKFRSSNLNPLVQGSRCKSEFDVTSSYSKTSVIGESDDEGWSEGEFDNDDEEDNSSEFRYDSEAIRQMTTSVTSESVSTQGSVLLENKTTVGFLAIADYTAVEEHELSLVGGEMLRLLQEGDVGWVFVESEDGTRQGWAPATYLEPINEIATPSSDFNSSPSPAATPNKQSTSSVSSSPRPLHPAFVKPKMETAV